MVDRGRPLRIALADWMILVAASSFAAVSLSRIVKEYPDDPLNVMCRCWFWLTDGLMPLLSGGTLCCLAMRARRNRLGSSRLSHGLASDIAVSLTVFLHEMPVVIGRIAGVREFTFLSEAAALTRPIGYSVLSSWVVIRLVGPPREPADRLERVERVIGALWILLAISVSIARVWGAASVPIPVRIPANIRPVPL